MTNTITRKKIQISEYDAKRLKTYHTWFVKLRSLLGTARVVSMEQVKPDTVTMNSKFKVQDKYSKEEMILTLVFPATAIREVKPESNEYNVSILSPIGLSVLGRSVGDMVGDRIVLMEMIYQPEAEGKYEL